MNPNNLTFSSKIDPDVEDICFDILLNHLNKQDFEKVYIKNVALAPNEIIFFGEIDGTESIIRVRVEND